MVNSRPSTVGSFSFDPDAFFDQWSKGTISAPSVESNRLDQAIQTAFGLRPSDNYVYHAVASVTLAQVQEAVNAGSRNGLHAWYVDQDGKQIESPAITDIDAYVSLFASTTSTQKALTGFASNAKKGSVRAGVAENLSSQRVFPSTVTVPKLKTAHTNPYLDFWAWSCRNLQWVGPDAGTTNVRQSHHVLPIFYHHFGCVCPSFEAIEAVRQLAKGQAVAELGSGNGYWAYLMRRHGLTVHAVDNGDSVWRTMWVGDTVREDGAKWLARNDGGKDMVLLLVYPQVTTSFTTSVLKSYKGRTIAIAGTQNKNGFTAFKDETVDRWIQRERPEFTKIVQSPLPSFAAKDEALFIFQRDT